MADLSGITGPFPVASMARPVAEATLRQVIDGARAHAEADGCINLELEDWTLSSLAAVFANVQAGIIAVRRCGCDNCPPMLAASIATMIAHLEAVADHMNLFPVPEGGDGVYDRDLPPVAVKPGRPVISHTMTAYLGMARRDVGPFPSLETIADVRSAFRQASHQMDLATGPNEATLETLRQITAVISGTVNMSIDFARAWGLFAPEPDWRFTTDPSDTRLVDPPPSEGQC